MGTFDHLQRKYQRPADLASPALSLLRSSPSLASSALTLSSQTPSLADPAQSSYTPHAGYSLASIPIFPTVQQKATHPSPLQLALSEEELQLQSRINAARSNGNPLAPQAQQQLEQGLETDLSSVRVHTDTSADHLAHTVNAIAFTTGPDIFFRSGMYRPDSLHGMHLLAHEATHIVQQTTGQVSGALHPGGVSISEPGDRFEQAAEASATRITGFIAHQSRAMSGSQEHDLSMQQRTSYPGSVGIAQHRTLIHRSANRPAETLLIQRRVGYEFENRQIKLIKIPLKEYQDDLGDLKKNRINKTKFNEKYEKLYPERKTPILEGTYFTLEADDTMHDANIEFVVHGPKPAKNGFGFDQRKELTDTIEKVQTLAITIEKKGGVPFLAKDLSSSAEKDMIIHHKSDVSEAYIVQATAGIRLDKLKRVLQPSTTSETIPDFDESNAVQAAIKAINEINKEASLPQQSKRLESLLSLMVVYIGGARAGQQKKIMKNITPLMARTNFVQLFSLLPKSIKGYFQEHKDMWKKLVNAAVRTDTSNLTLTAGDANVNIGDWVNQIPLGKDLLQENDPDKSMGALGLKVDVGNPKRSNAIKKQPVFEFRRLPSAPPQDFLTRSIEFFDYAAKLNNEK